MRYLTTVAAVALSWSIGLSHPAAALAEAAPSVASSAVSSASLAAPAMTDAQIRARVDALIARMTVVEKAGQVTQIFSLPYPGMEEAAEKLIREGGAGSALFVSDPAVTNKLQRIAVEETRLGIPLLFGFDVIHGLRTIFPVPIGLSASWDPDLVERSEAVAAAEARAVGIHWTFAPNLDIARDPRWGRIVEGAGEDPYLASVLAAAHVRGFQGERIGQPGRIIAGPKHFAAYGASVGGRDYDEVNVSDSELWNVYLPPFKAAIDAGAGNVMSAYMGVNGVPASGNHWLLKDVLRDAWGFEGFVVSDADAVRNLATHAFARDQQGAATRAMNAGVDMEMAIFQPAYKNLPAAVESGAVSEARLDEAVRRILTMKFKMGLFDQPYVDEAAAARVLAEPAHMETARVAAERSAVLLRNEGGLLPLKAAEISSIALIGPLAGSARDAMGPWVFPQNDLVSSSILDGLRASLPTSAKLTYVQGVDMPPRLHPSPFAAMAGEGRQPALTDPDAELRRAVEAAAASDVAVLVLGEAQDMIGESASRSSLDLPGRQQELLEAVVATGKPVVVLLMSGRPLDLKGVAPQALMEIWYPGSAAGEAVSNLLFGRAAPGGKLPFTWPRTVGQVPIFYSHLTSHEPAKADLRYWNEDGGALYPFGYGLSYSSFGYANMRVDKSVIAPGETVSVSVDLTNTGSVASDEVAQLYIRQTSGTAARPVRELKGFQRVALAPGETRTITFELGRDELQYWNAASRQWVLDEAAFEIGVGGDSTTPLSPGFTVRK